MSPARLWNRVPLARRRTLESAARHFATAFAAVFVAGILGVWKIPDWETKRAAACALIVAAIAAGARAAAPDLRRLLWGPPAS